MVDFEKLISEAESLLDNMSDEYVKTWFEQNRLKKALHKSFDDIQIHPNYLIFEYKDLFKESKPVNHIDELFRFEFKSIISAYPYSIGKMNRKVILGKVEPSEVPNEYSRKAA